MNSENMWESRISEKQHLKNIKDPRGRPPSRQHDHVSRRRRSSSSSEGQHERRRAPYAGYKSSRHSRSRSANGHSSANGRRRDVEDNLADARTASPLDVNRWRSYRDLSNLEWPQRISLLKELSSSLTVECDEECSQIRDIIKELSQIVLQYSTRQLPEEVQMNIKDPRGRPPSRQHDHVSRRRRSSSSSEGQHERRRAPYAGYKSSRHNRSRSANGHSSANGRRRDVEDNLADARTASPLDVNRWRSYRDLSNLEWPQRISLLKELELPRKVAKDFSDNELCPTLSPVIQETPSISSPSRRRRQRISRRHHRPGCSRRHPRSFSNLDPFCQRE